MLSSDTAVVPPPVVPKIRPSRPTRLTHAVKNPHLQPIDKLGEKVKKFPVPDRPGRRSFDNSRPLV